VGRRPVRRPARGAAGHFPLHHFYQGMVRPQQVPSVKAHVASYDWWAIYHVRALAGPALLADAVVRRWQDHLPLHRLERIYGREGLPLARSTICGWHDALAELAKPLLEAMWADALTAPYLCTDATGVLVQAREWCRSRGRDCA
jgi:hypothetical protein